MLTCVLAFLPVVVVLVLVPGVNNVNVLRGTLASGPWRGMSVALGASTGILVWSAAVGLGVGGVLGAVPGGATTLRLAGGGFLVVSGLRMLRARPAGGADGSSPGYRTGLLVCLGNPRALLTAVSVLPQHALAAAVLPSTLVLGGVWAALAVVWNVVLVGGVVRGRLGDGPGDGLGGGRSRRVERGGGLAVVGLGLASLV